MSTEVGMSVAELRRIFIALENLHFFEEQLGSTNATIERLAQAVKPDVEEKIRLNLAGVSEALKLYDRDNPVSITFKAQKLTYSRA
jgi:hypothetical protein